MTFAFVESLLRIIALGLFPVQL